MEKREHLEEKSATDCGIYLYRLRSRTIAPGDFVDPNPVI